SCPEPSTLRTDHELDPVNVNERLPLSQSGCPRSGRSRSPTGQDSHRHAAGPPMPSSGPRIGITYSTSSRISSPLGRPLSPPLDQARVEAPRGHAPVDVGPRIEQLHLSVIVNLMNAAVGTNPPKAAQSVLGPLWLVVVLGGDTDGHRLVRCPLSSGATHRADRHLVHYDAEGRVLLEHPIGLVLSGRVPLLEVAPVDRGEPMHACPDINRSLPACAGAELTLVALLPCVSLARDTAHRCPPGRRRFTGESGRGLGEVLAVGLQLLQQLVVFAGDRQVVA